MGDLEANMIESLPKNHEIVLSYSNISKEWNIVLLRDNITKINHFKSKTLDYGLGLMEEYLKRRMFMQKTSQCDGVCEQCPEDGGKEQCEMWK